MDRKGVVDGTKVRSSDGKSLGKVVSCGDSTFMIEKGFFFPKDYTARYEAVSRIEGDEIWLAMSADELLGGQSREADLAAQAPAPSSSAAASSKVAAGATEEIRVPLAEEELSAQKRSREAGRVEVRKEVKTEQKQVTVPVTKEEVRVERVPAGPEARAGEASFQEGTVSVPIREEEVEIQKRPKVREEIRVSKTGRQEEVRAGAEVRKEEARIGKEGDVDQSREDPGRER